MSTLILAVDHRNSLRGWLAALGVQPDEIRFTAGRLKCVCVEALAQARDQLQPGDKAMLLLDEEYGADAIRAAKQAGLPIVIPAEQSGKDEFLFEHGENFREAIELLDPDAVKALVRYNVAGDAEQNRRSRERLLALQHHLRDGERRFMLELLVPATAEQEALHGQGFDEHLRPGLTVEAINELAADGLRPDWWKLEGNLDPEAARSVAAVGSAAAELGCLVLGRGQDRSSVVRWLQVAAPIEGFVGFAVGRTLWTEAFAALIKDEIDEQEAAGRTAAAYLDLAGVYRGAAQAAVSRIGIGH